MQEYIQERVIKIAEYILETGATVRTAAVMHKISKSTVHKDMSERLPQVNKEMFSQVRKVLNINKQERHIRGGLATKEKYNLKRRIKSKR